MKTLSKFFILILCLQLVGCAGIQTHPGSEHWYSTRMQEIEEAYKNKELTKSQYISQKNEADQIRVTCNASSKCR